MLIKQTRCDSYNTVQLRLLTGADETDDGHLTPRTATLPVHIPDHGYDNISATSLVVEPFDSEASPRWRPSTATSADGHQLPLRRRAVSPTVGNYFELSRDSTWAASIFSSRRSDDGNDDEESGFWATSPLRKYALFMKRRRSSNVEGNSANDSGPSDEANDEDDEDDEDDEEDEEEEALEEEDDDEEDIDAIEIFGHR